MNNKVIPLIDYFIYRELKDYATPEELWLYRCFSGMILFITFIVLLFLPFQAVVDSDFRPDIALFCLGFSLVLF